VHHDAHTQVAIGPKAAIRLGGNINNIHIKFQRPSQIHFANGTFQHHSTKKSRKEKSFNVHDIQPGCPADLTAIIKNTIVGPPLHLYHPIPG
jgi:hypothetical protein